MALSKLENPLDEELYSGMAPSGLRFFLNPKPGFTKTMGILGVRFGSTDDAFNVNGKSYQVPDGTAHFLEHKLFEDQDGDVTDRFAALGASCNAGTGFTSTSYLFSCTEKQEENLKLLLRFVQTPYFTADLIEKEQGIIGQEIKMYNDDPDWVVFFNLMHCLFRDHPVQQNITGSVESISRIDVDVLNQCYNAYYRPGNMILVMVGNLDPETVDRIIMEDGQDRPRDEKGLQCRSLREKDTSLRDMRIVQQMVVARPKVLLGCKDYDLCTDWRSHQAKEVVTQMAVDLLFGKSSNNYEKLYGEGVIDDTFSASYSGYLDFGFTNIGGDSDDPERFHRRLMEILEQSAACGIAVEDFNRQKNKYMGKFIRTFNSIESTAFSLLNFYFKGLSPSEVLEIIEGVTLDDLNRRVRNHFNPQKTACSIIEPASFNQAQA